MLALNFYAHLTDKYVKASKKQKKDLNNLKDKRKMEKKQGIYEITCATCKRKETNRRDEFTDDTMSMKEPVD